MSEIRLSLLVIRSADIERAQEFYKALGLELRAERHGNGLQHYAARLGDAVFEIYPLLSAEQATSGTRLGFSVSSVDETLATVARMNARIVTAPANSPWGRRAVVSDPDGHRVELYEAKERENEPLA